MGIHGEHGKQDIKHSASDHDKERKRDMLMIEFIISYSDTLPALVAKPYTII